MLEEKIMAILSQFQREEVGNRLSQFAVQALIIAIRQEFERAKNEQKGDGS